ncbi:Os01g0766850 [Oryza sativa Japonica Group]|uniref:Os01g0766850 protein n=1 Tax=Oryza sativa subsp. japonica TaxID=39947 RepID=A0A0P0V8L5_ORYSJ|nr:Os01g0766850 [Oryza sativa Japonica Group]
MEAEADTTVTVTMEEQQREATDSEGEEAGEPQEGVRGRGAAGDKRFVNPDAAIAAESDRNVLRWHHACRHPSPNSSSKNTLANSTRSTVQSWSPTLTRRCLGGFGFIQFASEESAARALKKDRHFLYGQWVEVSLAMPKQQNATSGTSKLPVQAHPFYPTTSSNFTAAANYPNVVNIVHVVTPMNCVVGSTFNPHIGFEVPGMKLSDGVINVVTANYSYQYPYLGGGEVPPQNSAMYLQAAHYYSGAMM